MARLPYLDAVDMTSDNRHLLDRPIAINRILAHRPPLLEHVEAIGQWVRWSSDFDPRLRELAIVYVGLLTGSRYEYAHHVKIALDFGATREDIDALRATATGDEVVLGVEERTTLVATDELVTDGTITDSTWDRLVELFGQDATVDLIATVSFYAMVVRLLAALQVDVEPEFDCYLEEHPMVDRVTRVGE